MIWGKTHGINYEALGWVTAFGDGIGRCDAPRVEPEDSVIFGPVVSGPSEIIFGLVIPEKDRIATTFSYYGLCHALTEHGFGITVGAIIFKK